LESQQLSVADCASEVNAVELISWGSIAPLSDRRQYRRTFANPGRIHTSEKSPSWTSASSGVQIRRIEEISSDKASRLVGYELEGEFAGVRGCTSTWGRYTSKRPALRDVQRLLNAWRRARSYSLDPCLRGCLVSRPGPKCPDFLSRIVSRRREANHGRKFIRSRWSWKHGWTVSFLAAQA